WLAPSTSTALEPRRRFWPSTARPPRSSSWRASCSATRRAPSRAPTAAALASSGSCAGARWSAPRSATCPWPGRPRLRAGGRRGSRELGREVREIDPKALERLHNYSWPGNIRELQSVLRQALLQASGTVLLPAFLPELSGGPSESGPAAAPGADLGLEAFIRQ